MGEKPTTVNTAAETVDSIIHAVIYDVGANVAIAALKAEVPFLNLPVISQLTDFIVKYIVGYLDRGLQTVATLQVIQIQVGAEKHEYLNSEFVLRQALLSGDQAQIDAAKEKFKAAFRSLVHSDGSTH